MARESDDQVKELIKAWWAANPMTYGREHGTTTYVDSSGVRHTVELGDRAFFEMADATFYKWNAPLHTPQDHFGAIFDYERFQGKKILEVGCGMGCMAMNWAQHGAQMTAIDLNPIAVQQTKRRFELFNLTGDIRQSDGESLPFEDNAFDFAYSWGVLHHTPGTKQAIDDLWRVLRPGGRVGVMLYNRQSLLYRYSIEYLEGYVHLENQFLSPLQLASRYSDGARLEGNPHTWPVTKDEVCRVLFDKFVTVHVEILGTDVVDLLDRMLPLLGSKLLPRPLLKALARRWGWSLWITGEKM